jgi:hypothetical protein
VVEHIGDFTLRRTSRRRHAKCKVAFLERPQCPHDFDVGKPSSPIARSRQWRRPPDWTSRFLSSVTSLSMLLDLSKK